jgi:DNA repair exonuclease SbcCD ATPase subunit
MLETLKIKNGYRHPNSLFDFQAGQTAITGKNESGKSVTLEMILFALWGSVALRGAAEDYKKLVVTLMFVVKDRRYRIERTTKNAKLFELMADGERDVAVGTKPVNAKMKEIFGYDFDVFTMANACLQGQIEKLSDSKPTERKKIVDQTIGLHVLDDLAKDANDEALTFRRQAEGIASVLREPVKPETPEGYESSTTLERARALAVGFATELNQLRGMVAHKPAQPVAPTCEVSETIGTLESLQAVRKQLLDARALADGTAATLARQRMALESERQKLAAELNGESRTAKELAKCQKNLAALVMPTLTHDQISIVERQWDMHDSWKAKQKLLAQGEHVCPSCDHHWPLASDALKAYADVVEMPAPIHTRAWLMEQRRLNENVQRKVDLEESIAELAQQLIDEKQALYKAISDKEVEIAFKQRDFNANEANVAQLTELLVNNPDQSEKIAARQKHEGALLAHTAQLAAYEDFFARLAEREARIAELAPVEAQLKTIEQKLVISRTFEQAQAAFEAASLNYAADKAKLDALVAQAEDYTKAKSAIVEAKTVIKSFLIPSLNKVASLLLNQMTGGARSSIIVDDDFNITVDGQQVQTLSGSGKAVANLALRIGLGQVLTNGVFSVFMADEFDESMDEERARYTAECLQRLKETIKQVIVVTHKRPIADHVFTLPLKEAA